MYAFASSVKIKEKSSFCVSQGGGYDAYVIKSVSRGTSKGRPHSLEIQIWYVDYFNGMIIRRQSRVQYQSAYDGEKEITSLHVFPCEFWKEVSTENEETQPPEKRLEARGKMFFKLAQRQCMDYDGITHSWPRKHVSISLYRV